MADVGMRDRLAEVEKSYEELTRLLGEAEVVRDLERLAELSRRHAELRPVMDAFQEFRAVERELEGARSLAAEGDEEIRAMAREECAALETRIAELEKGLRTLLLPKDRRDERDVVLEIRAGTGGEEAALFARDLFRMYTRYAEAKRWKVAVTDIHTTEMGGVREVVAEVVGKGAFSRLKFESGVHRVQRVPATEASGRIHTSAATVAVLPEAEEIEIEIPDKDLRVDTFCASGHGGQSVNTTYSAVRMTHLPTGLVVSCQDERSQVKNRVRAMRVLRARLYEMELQKRQQAEAAVRRSMVRSGDRSEKVRTYNFPQNRVTDHRIGLTLHRLDVILDGDLDEIIDSLAARDEAERLQSEALA